MGEYLVIGRIQMRSLVVLVVLGFALGLIAGSTMAYAQGTFKIPFRFEAAGKKFPAGDYRVATKEDGKISLRKEPNGEEIQVSFIQRLEQPKPPIEEPQLVFDVVGNFEPSYTEYITEYVLAEVWLPGEDGFLIHSTKGAHQRQTLKGEKAK
jgi:hypothetical protein